MLKNIVLFFAALLFSLLLFYPNISARWGAIDDHEIHRFLGSDLQLKGNEIIPTLLDATEVGYFGKSDRYRPAYFLLRIVECWAWGSQVLYWYLFHLAIYGLSAFLLWKTIERYLGVVLSGFFALILVTVPWQSVADIFTRLGPAETYAFLGFSLYLFSISHIVSENMEGNRTGWWFLVALASVLTIGVKENFIFIAPLTLLLLGVEFYRKRKFSWPVFIANLIVLSVAMLVFLSIYFGLSSDSTDIYENKINTSSIANTLVIGFFNVNSIPMFVSIAFYILNHILFHFLSDRFKRNISSISVSVIAVQVILYVLSLSQYIFYSGNMHGRYIFPFSWFVTISYIILIYYVIIFIKNIIFFNSLNKYAFFVNIFIFVFCILTYRIMFYHNMQEIHSASVINNIKTNLFTNSFLELVSTAKEDKNIPVIIVAENFLDVEPIHAIIIYMRTYNVQNVIAVRNELEKKDIQNDWQQSLFNMIEKLEKGYFWEKLKIDPFDESMVTKKHYIVDYSIPLGAVLFKNGYM